jgi:hypothetical protein
MAREARMIPGLAEADAGAGSVVAFKQSTRSMTTR